MFDLDLVLLISPKNWVEQNIILTKSMAQIKFDYFFVWLLLISTQFLPNLTYSWTKHLSNIIEAINLVQLMFCLINVNFD